SIWLDIIPAALDLAKLKKFEKLQESTLGYSHEPGCRFSSSEKIFSKSIFIVGSFLSRRLATFSFRDRRFVHPLLLLLGGLRGAKLLGGPRVDCNDELEQTLETGRKDFLRVLVRQDHSNQPELVVELAALIVTEEEPD